MLYTVDAVAQGAGLGQYRLDVTPVAELDPNARLIWWTEHAGR